MSFEGQVRMGRAARKMIVCALLVSTIAVLGGCEQNEKARKNIDQRAGEAQQSIDNARRVQKPIVYDPLTVTNKVYGGTTALRMQHGLPLPARFEGARGVTLVSADPMSINDIAGSISAQTGIPVRLQAMSSPATSTAASAPRAQASAPAMQSAVVAATSAARTAISGSDSSEAMPISYEGSLSGLLEHVSAYFGVSWRYDGASISMSRYETRVFTIEALPGSQEVREGMKDEDDNSTSSSSSSSSTTSGGSTQASTTLTQNSKFNIDFKYWDELTAVLNTIVGRNGSVVVSPSIGTVTIITTPDVMKIVSEYMEKENKRLGRQIAINVQVYSVNLQQSEDFNLAFTGFLKNLSFFSGASYSSASAPSIANSSLTSTSFGSLSVAILNGSNDPTAHAGDVFKALSAIGDTTTVAQFPMTTLNNRPVSRRIGTDTTYVASVTANSTTTTSTETVYTPTVATVRDGFSLQLTPRLLDDGRILLQYSLSLVGLTKMDTAKIGNYEISLPITDNRIFVQQSMLKSGSTLIIGGIDRERNAQNRTGVGTPENYLLGGGTSSDQQHYMMFIAITPQVMDVNEERN